jgi:hypothetical protein
MPFYLRSRPRRPLWHLAVAGAGIMLLWAATQTLRGAPPPGAPSGTLGRVLLVLALTLVGGAVTGGVYWALGLRPLRQTPLYAMAAATAGSLVYLMTLTLAASQAEPAGIWSRVTRPAFFLSSLLLSLVLGWLIARDPFDLVKSTERVYLTPAQYAALSPPEQDRLQIDTTRPSDPPNAAGAA